MWEYDNVENVEMAAQELLMLRCIDAVVGVLNNNLWANTTQVLCSSEQLK